VALALFCGPLDIATIQCKNRGSSDPVAKNGFESEVNISKSEKRPGVGAVPASEGSWASGGVILSVVDRVRTNGRGIIENFRGHRFERLLSLRLGGGGGAWSLWDLATG
jgi:hypothetical protein